MLFICAAAMLSATGADPDSAYEQTLIDWALQQTGREVEPAPQGKVIEEILSAREDVFSKTDPVPTWLNVFHGRTREYVQLREVLLQPGEPWDAARAAETERNLRALVIFAVAKLVPVKGRQGGIGVLVVTKDRWSLRANWEYLLVGTVLEYLHVPITEVNLLGHGIEATLDPFLRRDTFQLGEQLVMRRVGGTKLLINEAAGLVFNRATGKLEGSYGTAQVALPLLSLDQQWGFNAYGTWNIRRQRIFRGNQIWELGYPDDESPTVLVPYIYDRKEIDVVGLATRRFALAPEWKADVTAGLGGYLHQYRPPDGADLSPDVNAWFISTKLPRSEDAAFLYAQLFLFRAKYVEKHDIETFGLTEDFQVGPRLILAAKWAVPLIAPSSFVELGGSLRWRFFFGDDLLVLSGAAVARFQPSGPIVNEHYAVEVANWSPAFEGGRFVTRVLGDFHARDLDNTQFVLGAGLGLRGTPSGAYVGHDMVLGNFEYRTRPFNITTLLAGFVVFYDVGSAFDVKPVLTHTVGIGLRILIPQLNTQVIRLDLGFILGGEDTSLSADRFSSTFGQVTQLRPDFFDDPL